MLTPLNNPPEDHDAPKSRRSASGHGEGRVLIIDDDDYVRRTMDRVLRRAGYETASAPDGASGIELFREFQGNFDAITLDMCMPGLDGFSTFQELQRLDPEVRVVLCSGAADETRVRTMLQSGLMSFLPKPFEPSELLHVVALAIVGKSPESELATLSKTA